MMVKTEHVDKILELVRQHFPGWESVNDERFVKEEIGYKRDAVGLMNELLSKAEIDRLISTHGYDEIIDRLDKVGHKTNLLWMSVPMSGDLRILFQEKLDKPSYCVALRDLLYGEGPSEDRIDRYCEYLKDSDLPNTWPFPTYFLFLSYPSAEFFVKPTVTKWLLGLIGQSEFLTKTPAKSAYAVLKSISSELREMLAPYGVTDMIDVQSVVWVASSAELEGRGPAMNQERRELLDMLFKEFVKSCLDTDEGRRHGARYEEGRQSAAENFQSIIEAEKRGEDITDAVLLKFLTYSDTESNRAKGAFIHVAPSVTGDVKAWFEGAGWAQHEDWPRIAMAILTFVKQAHNAPDKIDNACKQFAELGYTKGFQTGMMSPILSALRPRDFRIVNNKSRRVINYFTRNEFRQNLIDYPAANKMAERIIVDLSARMEEVGVAGLAESDVFDMFCHWLVAVKKHSFRKVKYWKIAPGENAWNWEACRDGGFIAIGWDELGDLSGLSKEEFIHRWKQAVDAGNNWKRAAVNQVWRFLNLEEGDRIVANQGTSKVLGFGIVTGDYFFVPTGKHRHRVPVEWYDLEPRQVKKGGWKKTMIKLSEAEFQEISQAQDASQSHQRQNPFPTKTFELLASLHKTPTQEVYRSRYDEFKEYVEEPVQRIMKRVAESLPQPMLDMLEVKKGVFGRIPKNDYGKGGAWDFYWGAFYPKGGKRITDAQLFIGIHHDVVRYGFYIGEYGSDQRARFIKNCRDNASTIGRLLKELLPSGLKFEDSERDDKTKRLISPMDFESWVKDPERTGVQAVISIERDSILRTSEEQLVNDVAKAFMGLFPLMLLASSDDPMRRIYEYLEAEPLPDSDPYPLSQFSDETGIDDMEISRWVRAITRKGQIIFYGPPGTGKTYIAERLARHLIGGGAGFMDLLQFHPAYAYEDFIQGIRPKSRADGSLEYPVVEGRLMEFCRRARNVKGRCVLILDEINRANLSRVFGELMYLLEYRDAKIPLASGGEFQIPSNVYIIGTMNTADRSIALVDHALRRRFAFIRLYPNYEILEDYHEDTQFDPQGLINVLKRINALIADPHYEIGITFFLRKDLQEQISDVWRMEIEPYLEEFFFDQRSRVEEFRWEQVQRDIMLEADE